MTSLYATIAPHFTQDLLTPELKVGYCDESGSWPFVAASLSQRLPLRCIEWKNLVGATKFIDRLPVTFVAQDDLDTLPLVCIYLVKCEDMELYKSSVKLRLSAWVDKMNAAKVEWMVLYVPLGTRAKGRSSNTSVYKKIFDKIRADFAHRRSSSGTSSLLSGSSPGAPSSASLSGNSSGSSHASERICKIEILEGNSVVGAAPGQHQQHESQWSELLLRLRHCIMDAFQSKCYQYEEEVRVLDAKRNANALGWDFGAFFLAKERLALMYQQTYLLDDAIRHLDELDAIFMNRKDEFDKEDDHTVTFTSTDSIFTTAPLALDLPKMQQQIAANRASASVIQLHCFCRQIRTLYLMGNFPQLIERATAFISSFFQTLTKLSETGTRKIARHLSYQWAVGACLEIAYACELSWNGHDYQVSSASVPSHATQAITPEVLARHLGDLLYLARRTLKAFSRSSGMSTRYDSITSNSSTTNLLDDALAAVDSLEATSTAWYEWLQHMFASSCLGEDFERCVWEMSHLASLHYSRAGRHRFAVFLGGECARYHFRHREFESASRLFRSHSRQCEEDKWWNLVGDCVRNICSSELELGRAAEAVAVCFSMLGITQDAKTEIGRAYLEKMMHTLVQSLDHNPVKNSANGAGAKMKMGELITPSLAIETIQTTTNSDLDHGDVRVTLCVSNRFPAGIHIETLHVRFCRSNRPATARAAYEHDDEKPMSQEMDASSGRNLDSSSKEIPRLHSLVLEDDDAGEDDSVALNPHTDVDHDVVHEQQLGSIGLTAAAKNPNEASPGEQDSVPEQQRKALVDTREAFPSSDGDGALSCLEIPSADIVDNDGVDDVDEDILIFEENNVYLYEKASVHLVFLHGGLEVGQYVCTGIDCVLAGNSFNLMSASELEHIAFEIPCRESTLRITIDGPPLLTPQTIEQISITIDAHKDAVSDGGVLEIFSSRSTFDDIKFLMAELQTKDSSSPTARTLDASSAEASEKLALIIPPLALGERLTYRVWLVVDDVAPEEQLVPFTTVSASLRYQHVTGTESNVAVRRAEAAFQILYPLAEQIRLKLVDTRVFVAISLTCNSEHSVRLRDYRLQFRDADGNNTKAVDAAAALTMLQDPNGRLRGTKLRPGETVHLAFTLNCPSSDAMGFPDEAQLHLDLQYESGVCAVGDQVSDSLQQRQAAYSPAGWESTNVVRIPFDDIKGTRYRIDVQPRADTKDNDEYNIGEQIMFSVVVHECGATPSAQPDEKQDAGNGKQVLLCLDERSERDWILMGKQQELFELQSPADKDNEHQSRCFATQKRLIPTRVGRVRFPAFHVRQHGAEDRTPSERVLYPQSAKEVLVT
uniref:TRAPPC10/Trs130 N-terminal domain-containing protein n=1 Tax=Globisporangium ultimum (strain ATCC 200006 / CBS 805.95 / DAOM BR144) TaxID=431595 RepID=K3XA51_GLOUD